MTAKDPGSSSLEWQDGWKVGQVEGACSATHECLRAADPVAAATQVLEDLRRRFGRRAEQTGAFRDLRKELESHACR